MKSLTCTYKSMNTCSIPSIAILVVTFGLLAGCSKNDGKGAPSVTSSAEVSDKGLVTIPRKPTAENYTFLDISKNSYTAKEFEELRFLTRELYWSGMPKDMNKMATDYSPEYRRESNTFNQADLLKTLEPELQKKYEQAQKQKNYAIRTDYLMNVGPYDAEKKGFLVQLPHDMEEAGKRITKDDDSSFGSWSIRTVGLPADDTPIYYKPKDEAEARAIEEVLSPLRSDAKDRVFVMVEYEGSAIGYIDQYLKSVVILGVDNIVAVDKKTGKKLFTVKSEQLGKIKVSEREMRKALDLPEPKGLPIPGAM